MAGLERFNAQEQEAVRDLIVKAERSYDPMVFSDMLVNVCKQFRKHPLRFVEGELRRMNSGLFLIASPMTPEILEYYDSRMPHTGDQEYAFGLSYAMGDQRAWRRQLHVLGSSPSLNEVRLDTTGFLNPKRGSALAQWSQAANN